MAADLSEAALLYRAGEERNFPIPVGPEIRVGFDQSNDIVIPIEGVSRSHAKVLFDGKSYWIEDAGSAGGTFLNGRQVTRKQRLDHLDVLTLGRIARLIFVRKKVARISVVRQGIRAAWLEEIDGHEVGARRDIPRGSITIGRSVSANIVADSHLVSKQHARLERSGLQLLLTDLQSSNGTFVNGERVESRVLADGDLVSVSEARAYRVHIELGEVRTQETSATSTGTSLPTTLPMDWKTRIEWSPEGLAAFDEFRKDSRGAEPPREQPAHKPAPAAEAPATSAAAGQLPIAPLAHERAAPTTVPANPVPSSAIPAPAPAAASPEPGTAERDVLSETPPSSPEIGALSSRAAVERRVYFEGKDQSFSVGPGEHEVGRIPSCAVCVEGPSISRRHARLSVTPDNVILEDLGSGNGTYINDKRITGPSAVADGDLVRLGSIGFRVRLAPEPGAKTPSPKT